MQAMAEEDKRVKRLIEENAQIEAEIAREEAPSNQGSDNKLTEAVSAPISESPADSPAEPAPDVPPPAATHPAFSEEDQKAIAACMDEHLLYPTDARKFCECRVTKVRVGMSAAEAALACTAK